MSEGETPSGNPIIVRFHDFKREGQKDECQGCGLTALIHCVVQLTAWKARCQDQERANDILLEENRLLRGALEDEPEDNGVKH